MNEFYNEVSRRTDTGGTQINVAETKRVLAIAFQVLAEMTTEDALDIVAKGVAKAAKKL